MPSLLPRMKRLQSVLRRPWPTCASSTTGRCGSPRRSGSRPDGHRHAGRAWRQRKERRYPRNLATARRNITGMTLPPPVGARSQRIGGQNGGHARSDAPRGSIAGMGHPVQSNPKPACGLDACKARNTIRRRLNRLKRLRQHMTGRSRLPAMPWMRYRPGRAQPFMR